MNLLNTLTFYVRSMAGNHGFFNNRKIIVPLFIIQAPKGISAYSQPGSSRMK